MYRFIIYYHDLNAPSPVFHNGSVSGCYLHSLDLPLCGRRSAPSIQTIFAHARMLSNVILDSLIPDTVRGTVEEFHSVDALDDK